MSMSQIPDKLIYKGQNWNIKEYDYPMEDYFFKNPGKRPKSSLVISSCMRRYIASFSFIADELVLEDITVLSFNEDESKNCKSLEDIFEKALINKSVKNSFMTEKDPVFKLHWYNGLLTPMLDGKTAVIQLENGKIIKDLIMDLKEYNEFRSKWFERFKLSEEYKSTIVKTKKSERDSMELAIMVSMNTDKDALKYLPEPFGEKGG
jgi:hypothetical protein